MAGFSGRDEFNERLSKIMKKVTSDVDKHIKNAEKIINDSEKRIDEINTSVDLVRKNVSKASSSIIISTKGNNNHINISVSSSSNKKTNIKEFYSSDIKEDIDHNEKTSLIIKNIIEKNIDVFANAIFYKKGFLAWFRSFMDLRIYYKENHNYDYMMLERLSILERQDVSLHLLETISKFYPEDLMISCVERNNNIHFHCFGFKTSTLKMVYTHYLKNRKRLHKGDIRTFNSIQKNESEKQEHLKKLVKSLYK